MRIFTLLLLSSFFVANYTLVSEAFVPHSTGTSPDQLNQSVITADSYGNQRRSYRGSGRRAVLAFTPGIFEVGSN